MDGRRERYKSESENGYLELNISLRLPIQLTLILDYNCRTRKRALDASHNPGLVDRSIRRDLVGLEISDRFTEGELNDVCMNDTGRIVFGRRTALHITLADRSGAS